MIYVQNYYYNMNLAINVQNIFSVRGIVKFPLEQLLKAIYIHVQNCIFM